MRRSLLLILLFLACDTKPEFPISDHFDGVRFHNLGSKEESETIIGLIQWQWTAKPKTWPMHVTNKNYPLPKITENFKAVATFINHATYLVQLPGLTVLTDPVYSKRVSPYKWIGPKRVRAPGVEFEMLPPIDVVTISHNHYDHLDIDTLIRLDAKFHPLFIVPLGDAKLLLSRGIMNVVELDWWQEQKVKDSKIIFTPAQHWSGRWIIDKYHSLWGSFWIESPDFKVYFAGDSGYSVHFSLIKEKLGSPDLALLPIGAYHPKWFMKYNHMGPSDAVKAHIDLGAKTSLGMHYGTFQLTDEGIDSPINYLNTAVHKAKLDPESFTTLDQGESQVFK